MPLSWPRWQQVISRKPLPHSQPGEQERWLVFFCLSIVCLLRPPWLPQHLWLPVSLGREEVEGRKAGWGEGGVHTRFVPQIKKAEMDRKTLDWEIVELTNKLLDAKNTINKLEELNVWRGEPFPCPWLCPGLGPACLGRGWPLTLACTCRSGTGWTATWLCSSSSATSPTSATTSSPM